MELEPKLKQCRACGACSEKMEKCPICKDRFQIKWSAHGAFSIFIVAVDRMLLDYHLIKPILNIKSLKNPVALYLSPPLKLAFSLQVLLQQAMPGF
jgi:hypothetical protein